MSRSVGSNPTVSAIKETSFVYQGKRGFLVVIERLVRYNHGEAEVRDR